MEQTKDINLDEALEHVRQALEKCVYGGVAGVEMTFELSANGSSLKLGPLSEVKLTWANDRIASGQ